MTAFIFLAGLGLTSIIAGVATAPYSAFHFQRIQPFGLVANILAMPLFSFWIMPLALVSVVLMPFGLDGPFLQMMGFGLGVVFEVARFMHDMLGDAPTGLLTREGLLVLSLALIVGAFLSSRLRWLGVPLAVLGLALSPSRATPPELLVFEDGKEIAMIDRDGALVPLRERPNDFVFSQWQRAFPGPAPDARPRAVPPAGFNCRTIEPEAPASETMSATDTRTGPQRSRPQRSGPSSTGEGSAETRPPAGLAQRAPRVMRYCSAVTRGGLKLAWTDDYRQTGRACDEADIAIVARAIRLATCRSGAILVTLRTLRRSGSLAVSSSPMGEPVVTPAMGETVNEWNRHRLAPWPEAYRRNGEGGGLHDRAGSTAQPIDPDTAAD